MTSQQRDRNKTLQLSRREMILTVGATGITAATAGCTGLAGTVRTTKPARVSAGRPKNIIMMVADGMSIGAPTIAEDYSRRFHGRPTHFYQMLNDNECSKGYLETRSLGSLVTDSAAAASAWGSGRRVNNTTLNMLPDGRKLSPITQLLKRKGIRVGLVTTDTICGATPGGLAVSHEYRKAYSDISLQYRDLVIEGIAPDVMMGGGREWFDPLLREDGADLMGVYRDSGYSVCTDRNGMRTGGAASGHIIGLFGQGELPYTIDRQHNKGLAEAVPSLSEMATTGLDRLSAGDNGYFLLIEDAHVDHAAHANDAAALIWDQLAFDEAIGVVKEYVESRDDTLMIITTDHGNGNPGLRGMGKGYEDTNKCFERLTRFRASYKPIRAAVKEQAKTMPVVDAARSMVATLTGIELTPQESEVIGDALVNGKCVDDLNDQQDSWVGTLSQVLGNYTGVGWTGTKHTSDPAIVIAKGPGAGVFEGIRPHKEVNDILCDYFGVSHSNPSAE